MSQAVLTLTPDIDVAERPRRIVQRTRGRRHGPITRLISPGDLGEVTKPFVFLDLIDATGWDDFSGFGLHPHSGIATLTHFFHGGATWEDTTGATGAIRAGGVEWFRAGGGAWHGGGLGDDPITRGFQLWVALPPDQELGPVESLYLEPHAIERDGPAKVLVGALGGAKSPIEPARPMTYLAVSLIAGETWRYQPPVGHDVLWIALANGRVATPETVEGGELVVFEPGDAPIEIHAHAGSQFVLGSAPRHRHDLKLGHYSVHTSAAALAEGEANIARIGERLKAAGRL